jgi:2Fe-2S ferredoxin
MEAAKELDLPEIPADCGGCQACGTCHIHVDDVWLDKLKIKENSLEQSLLEYEPDYIEGVSRLACQIQLNDELDNVTVKLRKNELL